MTDNITSNHYNPWFQFTQRSIDAMLTGMLNNYTAGGPTVLNAEFEIIENEARSLPNLADEMPNPLEL